MKDAAILLYEARDHSWALTSIDKIAALNTIAWAGKPWFETWDMDPDGTDERNNSYALVKYLAAHEAAFFSATADNDTIVGIGVTLPLSKGHLAKVEWGHGQRHDFTYEPQPGDLELHLVFVDPAHRGRGIFRKLAEARLDHIQANHPSDRRIWLQTVKTPDSTVIKYYAGLGFRTVGEMRIKQTVRVFMMGTVADLNKVGEQPH